MIYQYLGRKLVCLCWLLNIICVKAALPAKNKFLQKVPSNLISHNLGKSHQNVKKNSKIHIDQTRSKICKNEGFLKPSLFQICQICLILTKNGS